MKVSQLINLGFEKVKEYLHDQYKTLRFRNGPLEIELTYKGETIISSELSINMDYPLSINEMQLRRVVEVFTLINAIK